MTVPVLINGQDVPRIDPVPEGVDRPFWSVMIPTYNCAKYLQKTLESVLAQDPGPQQMQIEVLDDVSTKDDPEAVVREIGKGRVQFYRHPQNVGATANFNECLRRSRGRWVHILHGDDYVLDGVYQVLQSSINEHPSVGYIALRVFIVDELNNLVSLSGRICQLESPSRDPGTMKYFNQVPFPGSILSRDSVEKTGGFNPLLQHAADWEMWVRTIVMHGGLFVNKPLVCYREHLDSDTGRLARTSINLKEWVEAGKIIAGYSERYNHDVIRVQAAIKALEQARRFRELGDNLGYSNNLKLWYELTTWLERFRARLNWRVRNVF